jgi:hypothetical protein
MGKGKATLVVPCQTQVGAASDGQDHRVCLGAHMPGINHRSSSRKEKGEKRGREEGKKGGVGGKKEEREEGEKEGGG